MNIGDVNGVGNAVGCAGSDPPNISFPKDNLMELQEQNDSRARA